MNMNSESQILSDTRNQHGFVHELSETSRRFIHFSAQSQHAVLDVGAATGVASVPALEAGARVIAMDPDPQHLSLLEEQVPRPIRNNLTLIRGHFPNDLDYISEPVGAVLMSQVLGFVQGEDISLGFKTMYGRMVAGGKFFIINYTPFISITKDYLEIYERRCYLQDPWPGHCDDLARYCKDPELLYNLPNELNLMDEEVLARELRNAGFDIESSRYLGGPQVPKKFRLDGREWVEVIAVK